MNTQDSANPELPQQPNQQSPEIEIPQLVGKVYEAAPAVERCRLLEHLMRPLGVLSLVVVANGIFAKIWFRRGWNDLRVHPEDVGTIRAGDVAALVDHAQQVSIETVDALVQVLTTSPEIAGSAAATLLVASLIKRARSRRLSISGAGGSALL